MQILQSPKGLIIRNAGTGDAKLHVSRKTDNLSSHSSSRQTSQLPGSVHEEVFSKARALSTCSPVTVNGFVPGGDGPQETPREARMRHYAHSAGRPDVIVCSERGGIKVEAHPSPFSLVSGNSSSSSSSLRTMLHPPRLVPIRVVQEAKGADFEPFERSGFLHASLRSGDAFEGGGARELYSRSGHINSISNASSPSPTFSSSRSSSPTAFASYRSSPSRLRESFNYQDDGGAVTDLFAETMFSNRLSLSSEQISKIEAISQVFAPFLFGDKIGALYHFSNEPNIDLSIRVWTLASQIFSEATSIPSASSLQPLEFESYARDIARSICALVNGTFHSLSRLSVKSNTQNAYARGAQLGLWTTSKVESRFHSAVHSAEFELKTMLNTARSVLEKSTHLVRLEEEKEKELKIYRATASPIQFSSSVFENPLEPKGTVVGLRFDPLKREVPPSIRLSAMPSISSSHQRGEEAYQSPSPTFRQNIQSSGFTAKSVDLSHVTASLASTLDSIQSGSSFSPLALPPCVLATQEKGTVPRTTILGTKHSPRLMILSDKGKWVPGQRMRSSVRAQKQDGATELDDPTLYTSLNSSNFEERPRGGSPSSSSSTSNLKIMNASMRETLAPPGTLSPSFRDTIHSLSSSLSSSKKPEVKHVLMTLATSTLDRVLM